ncbi:MAG: ParB/RepB/Spo0J family partition protein [Actinomycetota bacterium]
MPPKAKGRAKASRQDVSVGFADPAKSQDLTFTLIPADKLEVIKHQRKPSDTHVKRVIGSIEHIGFIAPLIVVPQDDKFVIIDGQHRFLAAQQLEIAEFPAIVVPEELARRMLRLNIEKEPNIRERSAVALSIYRELVETAPDLGEEDAQIVDAVEQAHYVTLGLGYEASGRLAGSSFEPILKKCDGFIDAPLEKSYVTRQERAAKVLEANALVKAISDKLKETGAWHQFIGAQIISYANPLKRARKQTTFDGAWDKLLDKLHELEEKPEKVLHASGD